MNENNAEDDYRELTRRSYDATAIDYQKNTVNLQPETKAQKFLSYLSPNSRVLDLGCGPGRDAAYQTHPWISVVCQK